MRPTDFRFALRRWRHRPGLAVVATLVLALGIGATTAMFSIVNAVLLKDEPWAEADRLVRIYSVLPHQRTNPAYAGRWDRMPISWQAWRDLQNSMAFADVTVFVPDQQIIGDERTELVRAFFASSTLPLLVGAKPTIGRFFTAEEDEGDSGSVILSHGLWTRMFGADPDVVGQVTSVTPSGSAASAARRRTIVGVLPEGFSLPGETPDLLIPIGFHKYNGSFGNPFFVALARLAADSSVTAATSAAEPLVRREESVDRRTARVVTVRADRLGVGDRSLWLLLAGAALLLVVACSNVAGLLLSDARSRHHETAVRLALGGSRGAIFRQLLVEHAVLALAAGAAGLLLAVWMLPTLTSLAPPGLIGNQAVTIDRQIAGWSLLAAVVTTMLAGLIPSLAISSVRPGDALKLGARETTRGGRWRHRIVVAAQFGLATVLLVGAGLFGETLLRLGRQPVGFTPEGVAVVAVTRARQVPSTTPTPEERATMMELRQKDMNAFMGYLQQRTWVPMQSLLDRVAAVPGVRSVAAANTVPFSIGAPRITRLRAEGQPESDAQPVQVQQVSVGYFDVMGVRVLRGRVLEESTTRTGTRLPATGVMRIPAVISDTLARRAFTGDPLGRSLVQDKVAYDVVGVVSDVKQRGLLDDEAAAMYVPFGLAESVRYIVVRAEGDTRPLLPAMREAIEGHDAPMFVTSTAALSDLVADTTVIERGRAMLSAMYGGVALVLAAVGLYGLAARLVAERRREIGIRVALGAGPRDVRRLVMTDAWLIVGIGLLAGVPAAVATSRLAQGLLYGVAPAAPHVIAMAVLALAMGAVTATVVPAWRANRIDPAVTLREE